MAKKSKLGFITTPKKKGKLSTYSGHKNLGNFKTPKKKK